ncbi:MAG: EAL domain-containing protein [Bradyrhizobium sp.]
MTFHSTSLRAIKRRVSVASATLIFVAAVCAIVLSLQITLVVDQRAEALAAGKTDTANLAMSLTQHANLTIRATDVILAGLAERLHARDQEQHDGIARIGDWLRSELKLLPQTVVFQVADRTGRTFISSEKDRPQIDVSDREFFRHHLERDSRALFIGTPIVGRSTKRWVIPLSRRYNNPDGSFAGVATALLDLDFFREFYDQLDIGRDGAVILISDSHIPRLILRRPFVEANIGRNMTDSHIFQASRQAPFGTLEAEAVVDGVVRINSYRRSQEYPLLIGVAKSRDDVLAPWRGRAIRAVAETFILLVVLAGAGFLVWKMTRRLALAKSHLDAALDAMPHGLCMFDAQQRVVFANRRFRDIYGYPRALVRPGTPLKTMLGNLVVRFFKQDELTDAQWSELLSMATSTREFNIDGRSILVDRKPAPNGGWVATHEDITEQKRTEKILSENAAEVQRVNEYFKSVIDNMPQGVCLFDAEQRVIVANSRYGELYNLTAGQIKPGTTLQQILDYRREKGTGFTTAPDVYRAVNVKKPREIQDLADGRTVSISRRLLSDGGWLTTHEDITERRQDERKIAYLAAHDTLTGLPNRVAFIAALEKATSDDAAANCSAIFMLDLDQFKAVNDTLGHAAGDQLLKEVASRLAAELRGRDIVARLGGDEFAIIQNLDNLGREVAISLALRIIDTIAKPFDLGGHAACIGTSIGIALCPEQGSDPSELMKKADIALYTAKAQGRNDFRIFDAEMMKVSESQKLLEIQLRHAIEREQFELYYQPILDAKTGKVSGAEALIRWHHPERGLLPPDQFIPLAEETGLIVPLSEWVLQQGCRDAAAWSDNLKIAINLSAHHFKRSNLFDVVLCTLVESGLSPARLELEITESALLDQRSDHLPTLRQLRNIGVSIVLDDFGTGYSSARYLTLYPFDKIKIDRSFVQGMATQRECSAIVASTLALARGLGIAVTAEGIETEDQLRELCQAGVDFAQGYLIGKPMALAEFLGSNSAAAGRFVA